MPDHPAFRTVTGCGYTAVNVAGGITEWYRAGHPVTYQQAPEEQPPASSSHVLARLLNLVRGPFQRNSA